MQENDEGAMAVCVAVLIGLCLTHWMVVNSKPSAWELIDQIQAKREVANAGN